LPSVPLAWNWAILTDSRESDDGSPERRSTDDGALRLLRENEGQLASGPDFAEVSAKAGIVCTTDYNFCLSLGGKSRSHLSHTRAKNRENQRRRKIAGEPELGKLIPKERLDLF
jgi:hypothetical protein